MATVIIIVVVIVLALAAVGGTIIARRRRSQQLQEEFGPEYDRVLEQSDSQSDAEKELAERKKRHSKLELRDLDESTRERYRSEWQRIQGSFVDDPGGAVDEADQLVTSIMRDRGYPTDDDFEQRAADISVEHPRVVEHYREARRVRDEYRHGSGDGSGTEDLRGAVTAYRNLVEELLDGDGSGGRHRSGDGSSGSRDESTGSPEESQGSRSSESSGSGQHGEQQSADGAGQADAASGGGNRS